MEPRDAQERLRRLLPAASPFSRFLDRLMRKFSGRSAGPDGRVAR